MPENEDSKPPTSTNEVLDRFEKAAEKDEKVSVDDLMEAVGRRSFGPLILLAGIVLCAPGISDIPSVATITGLFILLISAQMLFGRGEFWLPGWLLRRSVSSKTIEKMAGSKWTRRPAKWIDKFVTERLAMFAGPKANYWVAGICTVLALASPITEMVPLSGMGLGSSVVAFGISLIARDGLMTLLGFAIAAVTVTLAVLAIS